MTTVLSVDPGSKGLGWARWLDGQLIMMGYSRSAAKDIEERAIAHALAIPGPRVDVAVVERMTLYPGQSKSQAAANDLLDLQLIGGYVAGACLGLGGRLKAVRPSEWKGQVPKEIMGRRIVSRLHQVEAERLTFALEKIPASLQHNLLDAVGIGLAFLGRL